MNEYSEINSTVKYNISHLKLQKPDSIEKLISVSNTTKLLPETQKRKKSKANMEQRRRKLY